MRALDRDRFRLTPVGITRAGKWVLAPDDPDALRIVDGHLPEVAGAGPEILPPVHPGAPFRIEAGADTFVALPSVDVVFPMLHGPWGEDGTVQGLLEIGGTPYVGSGVFASSAGMDKAQTKAVLTASDLPVGRWVSFHESDWRTAPEAVAERIAAMGWPVFVKPCRAGSSVGVSKVKNPDGLASAVAGALAEDPKVIVEASVEGAREIECAVLLDPDGAPAISAFGEIRVGGAHEFYDFEAKYLDDAAELIVPAPLEPTQAEHMRQLAHRAFRALDCEGLARVDFFLGADGEASINEVNTLPGFTPISMYPRLWAYSGVDYPTLISRLLDDALRRGTGLR